MRKFFEVARLELVALVRTRTVAMLAVASLAWMAVFPHLVRGDGTPEGVRELTIHFSLGGVFALLVVALLASATASIAKERAERRLQLTMVRPVRYSAIVLGKIAAHVAAGSFVLALACAALAFRVDLTTPCNHVLKPVMPTPQDEAKVMYEAYMADTNTPVAVRHAKKSVVLRLLANRAVDRYDTILTNSTATWKFRGVDASDGLAVRMRFTNQLEMRQEVRGEFRFGGLGASISNITQAVLTVPLKPMPGVGAEGGAADALSFFNGGKSALMFRPRRDVELLRPADAFWLNLVRAYVEMVSILSLVIAFGTLLSSCLGRPVALFVAVVTLIVSEMSPSVVEQYPDELETNAVDRMGLYITRFAADVTRPVSSLSPLEKLAKDECVESGETVRLAVSNLLALPVLLSLLAAFLLPRKQEDE